MAILSRKPQIASSHGLFAEYQFDKGSMAGYSVIDGTPTLRITPVKHWSNTWAWYCIRTRHLAGKTPHFLIDKANHYSMTTGEKLACWSQALDTDTWYNFDNVNIGTTDLEFYNNTPFPTGKIYIAALPVYPFSRITRKVNEWLNNPLVSDTASSTNGVISYSTARDAGDGSGRTVPALPYYAFKISNGIGTKNKIVLSAYNHPSEVQGIFQLEGCIDWLLGGSELANYCLNYNDFYVYPCLNPQGVWAGYFRSSPRYPNTDHNRIWNTTGSYDDADVINNAITTDTGGVIEAGIDFHAWMDTWKHRGYTSEDMEALHVAFKNRMTIFEPSFINVLSDTASMIQVVFKTVYSARLHYSMEFGTSATHQITDYKTAGEYSGKTLAYLSAEGQFTQSASVGSRDFNGTTDRIDWNSIGNLTNNPITISLWVNFPTNPPSGNAYPICIHSTGDTNYSTLISYAGTRVSFIPAGGTGTSYWNAFCDGSGGGETCPIVGVGWVNIICTWTGETPITLSNVKIYRNGVSKTPGLSQGTSPTRTADGKISLGGRIFDDTRNADGMIAQVGVWNRIITESERNNLASGYSPNRISSGLIFYFSGQTNSLEASPGGTGTADGTTHVTGAGNGPGILY